ncbi:MAG: hypothetical protein COB67_05950 [SAR324 cluster bacterium]|uniref:Tyr recombinase domain-containing protein n=1 Tax=SAR324 cluster bacterium TaxID=2024889 RepID=A0A2A4T565_9DELT|nr:MAG: hypothetical protein COB67_05950 [SAR324 cluster bacterium]
MGRNLNGSTLEKQKKDLIHKTLSFGNKKSKETIGMIHSCERLDGKNSTFNQLVFFLNGCEYDIKLNLITVDIVSEFLEKKVEDGNSRETILEHISKISSSFIAIERLGFTIELTCKDFEILRLEFSDISEKSLSVNRAFTTPKRVVENLYKVNERAGVFSELQYICGYRFHEVLQINPDKIEIINNKMYIKEGTISGKGGFPLHQKQIPFHLGKKILDLYRKYNKLYISLSQYNTLIKQVSKQKYSSHSFRYSYAQELFRSLINIGIPVKRAKYITSEALGHHRISVVETSYLYQISSLLTRESVNITV